MAVRRSLRLLSALVVMAASAFAALGSWIDRLGGYTAAGTVGYYALPLLGIAGGVGAVVGHSPAARGVSLAVGAAATAGWFVLLLTQTAVNGAPL
jgi:hypothetical protein